eukprot:sb/3479655/
MFHLETSNTIVLITNFSYQDTFCFGWSNVKGGLEHNNHPLLNIGNIIHTFVVRFIENCSSRCVFLFSLRGSTFPRRGRNIGNRCHAPYTTLLSCETLHHATLSCAERERVRQRYYRRERGERERERESEIEKGGREWIGFNHWLVNIILIRLASPLSIRIQGPTFPKVINFLSKSRRFFSIVNLMIPMVQPLLICIRWPKRDLSGILLAIKTFFIPKETLSSRGKRILNQNTGDCLFRFCVTRTGIRQRFSSFECSDLKDFENFNDYEPKCSVFNYFFRALQIKKQLAYATGPFTKGLEGIPRWGGMHNQSYLQFQIRYRNCFGIVRKGKIRAFKCNRFQVFILSGTGDMNQTPQNRVRFHRKNLKFKKKIKSNGLQGPKLYAPPNFEPRCPCRNL